ncbi:MAG: hypothetical protein ACFCAD_28635 [Pleurocapsa sp.]
MMQEKSGYLSILIGVGMLFSVALGSGGLAYSFYRTEIAEEKEESSDMANDDSPFEQLKREKNIVITPVPQAKNSSGGISSNSRGISTGTYSNQLGTINYNDSLYSSEQNSSLDNFDSGVESDRLIKESVGNTPIDYSSPSASNNFHDTSENSLIKPLDENDFIETPTIKTNNLPDTSPLIESSF